MTVAPARTTALSTLVARVGVAGGAVAITLFAAALYAQSMARGGLDALEVVLIVVFALGLLWVAWAFCTFLIGAAIPGQATSASTAAGGDAPSPDVRTALLFPIYNEDVSRVMATVCAMHAALAATGRRGAYDIYLLSDSTKDEARIAERRAVAERADALAAAGGGFFYRHRAQNIGRKAGNIEDFVVRWGGAYPYFIILDADSVMSAQTLDTLVARMEGRPDLALLQTLPVLMGRDTLFGRALQFAGALYAPYYVRGLAILQGADGAYWGHNAVIRTSAFAEACGLPVLDGAPPFGGQILSHDSVEGAFLRRRGYRVEIAADLQGSYEEAPPNLFAYAQRDRRWAQGNLQHLRLLAAPGLTGWGRLTLGLGVAAYLASPIWLLFVVLNLARAAIESAGGPTYFGPEPQLFPRWRPEPDAAAHALLGLVAVLLITPRLLILGRTLFARDLRGFGGPLAVTVGAIGEFVVSTLLAPLFMLLQSRAVLEVVRGRDSGWPASARDDGSLGFVEALGRTWWIAVIGAVAIWASARWGSPEGVVWLLPLALPMTFAPVLTWATASAALGRALRAGGVFVAPVERAPEPILAARRVLAGG